MFKLLTFIATLSTLFALSTAAPVQSRWDSNTIIMSDFWIGQNCTIPANTPINGGIYYYIRTATEIVDTYGGSVCITLPQTALSARVIDDAPEGCTITLHEDSSCQAPAMPFVPRQCTNHVINSATYACDVDQNQKV